MIKSENKIRELAAILERDNDLLIAEAIGQLREEQPFEGAIGLLAAFCNITEDNRIKKSIGEFMNDLKDQSAAREIIAELKKPYKPSVISMLAASCWQSGLNYSEYSNEIVEAFLSGDYVTAIECITVIEESADKLDRAKKDELIKIVRDNPFPGKNEKTTLILELISILNR